jgi:YD repeat-containing protein
VAALPGSVTSQSRDGAGRRAGHRRAGRT